MFVGLIELSFPTHHPSMKAYLLALIMAGLLAAVIAIVIVAVTGGKPSQSDNSAPSSHRLGSLVQPSPRRSASGYT